MTTPATTGHSPEQLQQQLDLIRSWTANQPQQLGEPEQHDLAGKLLNLYGQPTDPEHAKQDLHEAVDVAMNVINQAYTNLIRSLQQFTKVLHRVQNLEKQRTGVLYRHRQLARRRRNRKRHTRTTTRKD